MILYEVSLELEENLLEEFKVWLEEHRKEILETGLFLRADIFQSLDQKNSLKVCYTLETKKALDTYLENWAPSMREEGLKRFGGKFRASRKVYEEMPL